MFDYSTPISISICRENKWQKATSEVSLHNGSIFLETDRASWIKLDWKSDFAEDAIVLGDAWERTYGDVGWKPIGQPAFHPWYFTVREKDMIHCFGIKTGPSALCCWHAGKNYISLLMDVRCGCKDTQFEGRRVHLADLVSLSKTGSAFDVIHEFCTIMCPEPKLPSAPFYGGDDWYTCYGNNSFEKVLEHAKMLAECSQGLKNRPYQTVDAGWQLCHNWYLGDEYIGGPYKYCNDNFGNMKDMADAIRALDVKPGIWIRPMETVEHIPEDAYLRRVKNVKYLDPSHPYAREKMLEDIRTLRSWGYELIKHDFAGVDTFGRYAFEWNESAVEGDWSFYDVHRTSAEIIRTYYEETARAAGDALINACNTLSHLSAGIFPVYRIGDDTSGLDFARTLKMGVNALAARGSQHGALYAVDPDCAGITSKIPWELNREWLKLLQYSGTSCIVSVEAACYTDEVRQALTEAFALASEPHETARPIDWEDSLTPCRWETFDGIKEFRF